MHAKLILVIVNAACLIATVSMAWLKLAGVADLHWLLIGSPLMLCGGVLAACDLWIVLASAWICGRVVVKEHDQKARKRTPYRKPNSQSGL